MLPEDSPYQRKWVSFFVVLALVTGGFIATILWEAARSEYATYGGLLLGLTSIYFGANIGNKWAVRRGVGVSVGDIAEEDTPSTTPSGKAFEPPPTKPK